MAKVGILKIKKLIDALLEYVHTDYLSKVALQSTVVPPSTKNYLIDSFVHRCFDDDDSDEGILYRGLAIDLITRPITDSRRIETRLMFDPNRASLPTIHVREPSKSKGRSDSVGITDEELYFDESGEYQFNLRRSFDSQYEVLITSSNRHEVLVLEELLLALFISSQETLCSINPFYLFNFSVKELILNQELAPNVFIKSIGISTSYDKIYPEILSNEIIEKVLFEHILS